MGQKFSGKLNQRLDPLSVGLIGDQQDKIKERSQDFEERLGLLCEHYNIEIKGQSWLPLVLAMAKDFVPGFQEKQKRGRKKKWDHFTRGVLVVEVDRLLKENPNKSMLWACNRLSSEYPWNLFVVEKEGALSATPGGVLTNEYYKADERWSNVTLDAMKLHVENNEPEKWKEIVASILE